MEIKRIIIAVSGVLVLAGMIVFYAFDPQSQPFFPKCFFHFFTGYKCPGCGTQRAIHNLMHLQIGKAFSQNAFMIMLIPYLFLGIYFVFQGERSRFANAKNIFFGKWAAIVWGVFILAFWILRNV